MKRPSKPRSHRKRYSLVVDEATSRRLGLVRQRDTSAEQMVRKLLHRMGFRFRLRTAKLPGSPDIVNVTRRWAVFVHGCFWHHHRGCPRATTPSRNRAFWLAKFEANRARDRRVLAALRRMGFRSVVVWECEIEDRPAVVGTRLGALRR